MKRSVFMLLVFCMLVDAEEFTVAPPKKQPKLTVEQVCQNMMPENIFSAHINCLLGHNQATALEEIDDVMEGRYQALFNWADQKHLQEFDVQEKAYIKELQHFEQVLIKRKEFLKKWKQEVKDKNVQKTKK